MSTLAAWLLVVATWSTPGRSEVVVYATIHGSAPGRLGGCRQVSYGHCAFAGVVAHPEAGPVRYGVAANDVPANVELYAAGELAAELDAAARGLVGRCVKARGTASGGYVFDPATFTWGGEYRLKLAAVPVVVPADRCPPGPTER